MSKPDFFAGDRDKITAVLDKGAGVLASGNENNKAEYGIGPEKCATWRRRYADGETQREIARRVGKPRTTVRYHLNGKCSHS